MIRRPGRRTNPQCTAVRHGTEAAYCRDRCRCPEAREDRRIRCKRRRHGRGGYTLIDGTGTARRVQGMAVQGWTYRQIGERLDCAWQYVQKIADRENPKVRIDTADRVRAIAADLAFRPGTSQVSRRRALDKGWVPLGAWPDGQVDNPHATAEVAALTSTKGKLTGGFDPVKVERAIQGTRLKLTSVERLHAVHVGRRLGMTHNAIALTLGMSLSTARVLAAKPLPEDCEVAA